MIIKLDDLSVYFPYSQIYPEQLKYIKELKSNLDTNGHILIEMPSGTGKTVALLSITISYIIHMKKNGKKIKLVYCSRTVSEIDKALSELENLVNYIKKYIKFDFLGVGLTAKKNLCVNNEALQSRNVDMTCKKLRDLENCDFYTNLYKDFSIPQGVYTLEKLLELGKSKGICPYYLIRNSLPIFDCIIYTYNYLIDPKIYGIVSKDLSEDCIIIFDEAHNIDSHCIEALTYEIKRKTLDNATKCLKKLVKCVDIKKKENRNVLLKEYQKMKGTLNICTEDTIPHFYAEEERKYEFIPGNLRDSAHFVGILKRLVEFFKTKLKTTHLTTETPVNFCQSIRDLTFLDKKTLKFCSQRLGLLIQSLEFDDDDLYSLRRVADFGTMVSMYSKGFSVIFEPYDTQAHTVFNPILRLACLDSSIAISQVFSKFKNVIITSGTLSPIEMYPKILNFVPKKVVEIGATLDRNAISPLILTKGNDQMTIKSTNEENGVNTITTSFSLRSEPSVVRNYGTLLIELSKNVPDGLICFFPSYIYMEEIVSLWSETNIITDIMKNKLIFIESPDHRETDLALNNYKKACRCGRGAVLFCVARGKVSEGVDFEDGYGRCVVMLGIPFQYTESVRLKKRLEFLRNEYNIKEYEFLTFDAMRHTAQCLGRVLRNKKDYGLMILADQRFDTKDKKTKLPKWIQGFMEEGNYNLSIDMVLSIAKRFYKEMAQELPEKGISTLTAEEIS
ncbi:general transcription and DNA repair factor IIH helicase subunit XPD (RAD3) [Vairimorpha necatrix]|uniref:DNA 5'-3' helicase n=1 Tax=Vairimorpha necatrix TaxID=6039 RepID=A0AAX4JBQ4_9MICR